MERWCSILEWSGLDMILAGTILCFRLYNWYLFIIRDSFSKKINRYLPKRKIWQLFRYFGILTSSKKRHLDEWFSFYADDTTLLFSGLQASNSLSFDLDGSASWLVNFCHLLGFLPPPAVSHPFSHPSLLESWSIFNHHHSSVNPIQQQNKKFPLALKPQHQSFHGQTLSKHSTKRKRAELREYPLESCLKIPFRVNIWPGDEGGEGSEGNLQGETLILRGLS